jgi:hypothetical protein
VDLLDQEYLMIIVVQMNFMHMVAEEVTVGHLHWQELMQLPTRVPAVAVLPVLAQAREMVAAEVLVL